MSLTNDRSLFNMWLIWGCSMWCHFICLVRENQQNNQLSSFKVCWKNNNRKKIVAKLVLFNWIVFSLFPVEFCWDIFNCLGVLLNWIVLLIYEFLCSLYFHCVFCSFCYHGRKTKCTPAEVNDISIGKKEKIKWLKDFLL